MAPLRVAIDDRAQRQRIDAPLADHGRTPESLRVTDVVLAEAVRTLQSGFVQTKATQWLAVRSLLDGTAFAFEERDAVSQAAEWFEHHRCGFSDCLVAARHARQGCDFTATLDRGMPKLPGVRSL